MIAAGTYTGTTVYPVITINKDLVLSGGWNTGFASQDGSTVIDGQVARCGIMVSASVNISNFTVQNSSCNSDVFRGGISNYGHLTIENSIVTNNKKAGIYNNDNATLTINKTTVFENPEGGINNRGILFLNYSSIKNNKTPNFIGGGISNSGFMNIDNSIIANNQGGGIHNSQYLNLNNSSINYNSASTKAGGIFNQATLIINNTNISGNIAYGYSDDGGGILNENGKILINNSTLADNRAIRYYLQSNHFDVAGGIYISSGSVSLANTILARNGGLSISQDCVGNLSSRGFNLIGNTSSCNFIPSTGDLVGTWDSPVNPRLSALTDHDGITAYSLLDGSPA